VCGCSGIRSALSLLVEVFRGVTTAPAASPNRKKASEPVSPRALKHVQELVEIVEKGEQRACLLFVVQRTDVDRMCITRTDPIYRAAVKEAVAKGVMLKAYSIRWDGSQSHVHRELPFDWSEE
jgi:DNA-binding sugar fermentation-stimulating protein